jgi:hypothetical protein
MSRPSPRTRSVRTLAGAVLLVLTAGSAAGSVRVLAPRAEHACCSHEPSRAGAPTAPCEALLPLPCCRPVTVPAAFDARLELRAVALAPGPAPVALAAPDARRHADSTGPGARAAPPGRLSVVLQL